MPSTNHSLRFAIGQSGLGPFAAIVSDKGLAAILFGNDRAELLADLAHRFAPAPQEDAAGLVGTLRDVATLIERPSRGTKLALDPQGSPFERKVWRALQRIPAGQTASYADVARRIRAPRAMRAVARARAANPIAVAIPCHRVVRSDGATGGYRWGGARKAMLLAAEAAL